MAFLQCTRCGDVGHDAAHCPFFRRTREAHADAQMGDNVPHMNQVNITIRVDGAIVEQWQRAVGWFYHQRLEIPVKTVTLSWARPRERVATASSTRSRRFYRQVCSMYLLLEPSWNGVMLDAQLQLSEGTTSIWPSIGQTSLTSSVGTICKV